MNNTPAETLEQYEARVRTGYGIFAGGAVCAVLTLIALGLAFGMAAAVFGVLASMCVLIACVGLSEVDPKVRRR